jgi:hypothetical protein
MGGDRTAAGGRARRAPAVGGYAARQPFRRRHEDPVMRRPTLLALAALLAVLLLAVPAAAAEAVVGTDILAVDGEPVGPEPQDRNAEGNAATELAGFEDREIPFTWAVAWLLTAAGVLGLAAGYLFYRFRVKPHA